MLGKWNVHGSEYVDAALMVHSDFNWTLNIFKTASNVISISKQYCAKYRFLATEQPVINSDLFFPAHDQWYMLKLYFIH
jgi:hypothetical protein